MELFGHGGKLFDKLGLLATRDVVPQFDQYVSDRWYSEQYNASSSVAVQTAERLYAQPVRIHKKVTVNAIGFARANGGSGSVAKGAIYDNSGAEGGPGSLIVAQNTEIDTTSGTEQILTLADTVLNPGIYWLAVVHNWSSSAPNLQRANTVVGTTEFLGSDNITGAIGQSSSNSLHGVYADITYANLLPDPFPSFTEMYGNSEGAPILAFRVA